MAEGRAQCGSQAAAARAAWGGQKWFAGGRVAVGGRAAGVDTRLAVVWVTCGGLLAAFSVRYARDRPAASTFLGFVPSFLLYSLFGPAEAKEPFNSSVRPFFFYGEKVPNRT